MASFSMFLLAAEGDLGASIRGSVRVESIIAVLNQSHHLILAGAHEESHILAGSDNPQLDRVPH